MARGPSQSGRAPAHLTVLPGGVASGGLEDLEEDRTTIEPAPQRAMPPEELPTPIAGSSIEEQWEEGTTVAEQSSSKRTAVGEEPTLEDQARPIAPLQLVPSIGSDPTATAKLVVIGGTDQGRVFDLRSGADVRIGRAVDNDVVLTDIAVSRKHLVLQWDGSAWVVQDNGSGNGTLINDRLEDGRCQLHHGDRVEIGNTIFRLDHPHSAHQPSLATWSQQDDEAATVTGKPLPTKATVRPAQIAATAVDPQRPRPQSVTAPVRDRTPAPARTRREATVPPPLPRDRPGTAPTVLPRPTSTMSPPPVAPVPVAPDPVAPPRVLVPTLTSGRGWAGDSHPSDGAPSGPIPYPMSGPYTAPSPVGPAGSPYSSPFDGGLRPMTSTAQVDRRPFPMGQPAWVAVAAPHRRRGFLIAAGVVAMVSLVAAGAMVGGTSQPANGTAAGTGSVGDASAAGGTDPTDRTPAGSGSQALATTDSAPAPSPGSGAAPPPPAPTLIDAPTVPAPTIPEPTIPEPTILAAPPTRVANVPRPPPTAPARKPDRVPKPEVRPRVVTDPGRRLDLEAASPKAATPKGLAAAEKKADGQYKAKDWKGAATTLREAVGAATDPETKALRTRAADYETIGANLAAGTAVGAQRPTEALAAFLKGQAADRRVGGAHQLVFRVKIGDIAPAAAASWMVKQNYEAAKSAADQAVNVGAGASPRVEGVRNSLERKAGEFYASAVKLQSSKPEEAKTLARRITKMVPASSPWYAKAIAIIKGSTARDADE